MNSGTLKCRWPEFVKRDSKKKRQHTFLGKGEVYTSTAKADKQLARFAKGKEILSQAKAKAKVERVQKALAAKRRGLMLANPQAKVGGVKTDKNGKPYVQPREGGKFGKRINL